MGLFGEFRDMIQNAGALQQQAAGFSGPSMGVGPPPDPRLPQWAPIEGVTLDQFATISAELAREPIADPAARAAWFEARGLPYDRWPEVSRGWNQRMANHLDVTTRFGLVYAQVT